MRYFDTHCHIGLIHEDPIEQLLITQEAKQDNVEGILSITNNIQDFFEVYSHLKSASNVYYSIGVSPSEVNHPGRDWESRIEEGASFDRVVAIGEIGLDYYRKFGNKNSQIELFIRQLELAEHLNKPVVIHNREAGRDILEILQDKLPAQGGILHCYSEDWDFAKKALDLNLYISFAGNVTYRNARNLHETARNIPLDRMVIESEAPFMIPAEYRGKRNKPSYIHSTCDFLADLREMDPEELSEILYQNSQKVFNLV